MKIVKCLVSAALAGMCISLGGLALLSVESRVLGAFLFSIGLFVVCSFGLKLFTGKVCYVWENDRAYALELPLIWLGNLLGTGLTALCLSLTRSGPALGERALVLCQPKLADGLLSLLLLGLLCNIFIYIAVEGYRSNPHGLGKILSVVLGVAVFILAGTEHCVADMFYFSVAGVWGGRALLCILTITLGNALGGLLIAGLHRLAAS